MFGKIAMAETVLIVTIILFIYIVYRLIKFIKRKIG